MWTKFLLCLVAILVFGNAGATVRAQGTVRSGPDPASATPSTASRGKGRRRPGEDRDHYSNIAIVNCVTQGIQTSLW